MDLIDAATIEAMTGYKQPGKQVDELRRQGFWRARRSLTGAIILERAHYEAVCRGEQQAAREARRPRLQAV